MTKRGTISQILVNLGSGWLASAIRMAISLFMVPFLLLHLGKDGFGLIGLLAVITSLTAVADLGLRSALGRELAEQVANNDKRAFSEITSTAFVTYLLLAALFSTILFFIAPWVIDSLKIPDYLRADAINLLRIYGVFSIILSFVVPVFSAGLSSHHRYDVVNGVQIAGGVTTSIMLFTVISFVGDALYGWMYVTLGMEILIAIVSFIFFGKVCSGTSLRLNLVRSNRLRSLLQLGGKMYAIQLTNILSERSDPLIISYFLGPAGVAIYQSGQKLSQSLRPIVLGFVTQIDPLTTRYHVLNLQDQQQKLLIYGTKFTLLFGSLAGAGIISLALPFCTLWLDASLGTETIIVAKIMVLWACADLLNFAAGSQFSILLGMKKLNFLIWTQLPTAVLNIALSIYFVGFTSLGLASVLYSTIIINLIRRPILMWYTAGQCGMTFNQYFALAYTRPLICFCLMLCIGHAIQDFANSWQTLILSAISICAVWAVLAVFIGLNKDERHSIKSIIRSRRQKSLRNG